MSKTRAGEVWNEIKPFAVRDLVKEDNKTKGNPDAYAILLYDASAKKITKYSMTEDGLTAALAAAESGDTVFIPPGTITLSSIGSETLEASEDTRIASNLSNNYGVDTTIIVRNATAVHKSLLRFDLSGIPAGTTIDSCKLVLTSTVNETSRTYNLYEISDANGDWIEGAGDGSGISAGEPNWNYKEYNTVGWAGSAGLSTAGTDYINTVLATATAAITIDGELELTFNASGLTVLESWCGGVTNNGFLIQLPDTEDSAIFYSSEGAHPPYLTLSSSSANITIPSGVEVVGLTKNSVIDGSIINNGKVTHLTVTGAITGGEYHYFNSDGELVTSEQINSDVATGTAPLVIASETMVDNLNADLLDGKDASDLLDKATYDTDDDGLIDTAHGGTELDTSAETGIPHLDSGTWSILKRLSPGADIELTIATGEITVTQLYHRIDTESDAVSDDLDTINGLANDGELLILHPENDARDVVLKHGTGNIYIPGGSDITLDDGSYHVLLIYDAESTNWCVVGGGSSGGGSDASDITYTPTVDTDWDGDADPGDLDDALNQLAERVDDNEIAIAGIPADIGDLTYTPTTVTDWDGDADPGDADDALDQLAERVDDNEIAIAGLGGGGSLAIDDLSDVNEGTPSDGDVLTYDGTASEWVSEAPSGGSGGADILEVQVFT